MMIIWWLHFIQIYGEALAHSRWHYSRKGWIFIWFSCIRVLFCLSIWNWAEESHEKEGWYGPYRRLWNQVCIIFLIIKSSKMCWVCVYWLHKQRFDFINPSFILNELCVEIIYLFDLFAWALLITWIIKATRFWVATYCIICCMGVISCFYLGVFLKKSTTKCWCFLCQCSLCRVCFVSLFTKYLMILLFFSGNSFAIFEV